MGNFRAFPALRDWCPLMLGAPMPNDTQENPQMVIQGGLCRWARSAWGFSAECILSRRGVCWPLTLLLFLLVTQEASCPWAPGRLEEKHPHRLRRLRQSARLRARALPGPFLAVEPACEVPLRRSGDWQAKRTWVFMSRPIPQVPNVRRPTAESQACVGKRHFCDSLPGCLGSPGRSQQCLITAAVRGATVQNIECRCQPHTGAPRWLLSP